MGFEHKELAKYVLERRHSGSGNSFWLGAFSFRHNNHWFWFEKHGNFSGNDRPTKKNEDIKVTYAKYDFSWNRYYYSWEGYNCLIMEVEDSDNYGKIWNRHRCTRNNLKF